MLGNENLDFFYDVIRRMEGEQNIATRQIAAALAFLAAARTAAEAGRSRICRMPPPAPSFVADTAARDARREPYREARDRRAARSRADERASRHGRRFAEAPARRKPTLADGDLRRYRIDVGRNLGATPKEIVGAIANEGGIAGKFIGQIHLFADF